MTTEAAAPGERRGQVLIDATKPFTKENRALSWFYVVQTFALLALCIALAVQGSWPLWARAIASVVAGLTTVRAFILYHDFLHGALLRGSKIAKAIFTLYGQLILTPVNVWRQTHNYHHANTAKIVGSHVGSYAMLTVDLWRQASPSQRLLYKVIRHPVTISLGYVTIFAYGMCISAFRRNPRKNWDSLAALVLHVALLVGLTWFFGWEVTLLGLVVPLAVACGTGAYLFYAQHNFPGMDLQPRESWEYTRAALESSSYMEMGPVMRFFTGNIGYHHVHHLNPGIPFYRLPEAMAAIPELQHPHVTTLKPGDVMACFALKVWDPLQRKMVSYREADRLAAERTVASTAAAAA